MNVSAFILAAGLGERLRPITDHIPKPLLPILGKPVLQSVLEKTIGLPADRIGINLHYKKDLIRDFIGGSPFRDAVRLFPEDPVLGTGGALKNAGDFLKGGAFLVHNADIISDIDLEGLVKFHLSSGNLATLAVHDCTAFNNLVVDDNGFLAGLGTMCSLFREPCSRLLAFTGVAVYAPEFLGLLPEGVSSVLHAWGEAISAGEKIGTYDVTGCYWSDIGTPLSYARTVIDELRRNGETVCLHAPADWCRRADMDGYVVGEGQIKPISTGRVSVRNCIILPGARLDDYVATPAPADIKTDVSFENCILGPGFRIDLDEAEMLGGNPRDASVLIGSGGSDRYYYRLRGSDGPLVLMQTGVDDPDYPRQIEYTRFFRKYSIPVPELLEVSPGEGKAVFEDLGDLSLYSWLKCRRGHEEIEGMYKKVLDILVIMHGLTAEHASECPLLEQRRFDYEHLRWETDYFRERFLKPVMNLGPLDMSHLEEEFQTLALEVDAFPKAVIHRDFQSQNIMITEERIPRVIDYQGSRIGPPSYDVVSLLWDPYYRLEDDLRDTLLQYYIDKVIRDCDENPLHAASASSGPPEDLFRQTILPCRLQRHMQALGAYGYLSGVKGKKYFLKYVPEALRLLKEACLLAKDRYPELNRIIRRMTDGRV